MGNNDATPTHEQERYERMLAEEKYREMLLKRLEEEHSGQSTQGVVQQISDSKLSEGSYRRGKGGIFELMHHFFIVQRNWRISIHPTFAKMLLEGFIAEGVGANDLERYCLSKFKEKGLAVPDDYFMWGSQ